MAVGRPNAMCEAQCERTQTRNWDAEGAPGRMVGALMIRERV